MNYTVEDYNKTIHRGFVHPVTGKILWGKNPNLTSGLEWRTPEAWAKSFQQREVYRLKRYKLHKTRMNDIKLAKGCEVCGFGKHKFAKKWLKHTMMLLEFDHIDPSTKSNNVCDLTNYAWPVIQKEIDKCRVICKCCHAKHTGNQNRKEKWYD
tara:strand:- start:47 stop:505 length:459 start_codon:yes stop_codon:yes gene_type:complete